ncbi:MAG: DUF362 domain-containing protein, partial [Phycisphaerae bacterium]
GEVLIESLVAAGWPAKRLVCLEAPPGLAASAGTHPARRGFDLSETDFGSGRDQFASVLRQITALIDVPFLKTHNICGMTSCLKNLSHGLVKHPARYHGNGCSPYIGDIVGAAPIRSRLRLCRVDAFRVVFSPGPPARAATVSDEGVLLASTDPVAADRVGLTVLNDIRRERGLEPVGGSAVGPAYLRAAHDRGVGIGVWTRIDRVVARE